MLFTPTIHRSIFLFGVCSLAFGQMMGTVPTSVPQIVLMANWLLEGNFAGKWERLRGNWLFWLLSSLFLWHLFGLTYTSDMEAGWNDVRTKIPLMFLPLLFFSSEPLREREFHWLLLFFLLGSLCNTAWCYVYSHVLHRSENVRNASRFMSHIRLGLYLNMAIAVCVYLMWQWKHFGARLGLTVLALYFLFSFYALGLISGLVHFVMLVFLALCVLILRQRPLLKMGLICVLMVLVYFVFMYVNNIRLQQLRPVKSEVNRSLQRTPWGKPYIHFDTAGQKENGYFVLNNIQLEELQRVWKRRMPADSFNYAQQYNMGRYEVLTRYLASKGLTKDSLSVEQLSAEDLDNIRNGISNYLYPGWSYLHRRIYELVNEYDEFRNNRHVNGHSLTMRLYFWKGAWHVIKKNILLGVGTGDVQEELNQAYIETNSPLTEDWYKRPHNQFLTIWLALGLGGLLIFLAGLFFPAWRFRKNLNILYWPFLLVALSSFMVEDTLETQAGLTFFAFFNSLLLNRKRT